MRRFSIGCGHPRVNLRLLASGALAQQERTAVENHLAACADCQKYFAEIKRVTEPLAGWDKTLSEVEISNAARTSWEQEFLAATTTVRRNRSTLLTPVLEWCHDLVWPSRRIWAGFACAWMVILAINLSTRDPALSRATKGSRPSPEMVRAYLMGEGFLAEWNRLEKSRVTEPPKPPSPPPRSERQAQVYGT
jgi:hypothetical protein